MEADPVSSWWIGTLPNGMMGLFRESLTAQHSATTVVEAEPQDRTVAASTQEDGPKSLSSEVDGNTAEVVKEGAE